MKYNSYILNKNKIFNNDNLLLNIINIEDKENNKYMLIKYDKKVINNNKGLYSKYGYINLYNKYGLFRSLVLDEDKNIVSLSPSKSLTYEYFVGKNPDIKNNNMVVEEFIEGTMINMSYIKKLDKWEIFTKSKIGGDNSFSLKKDKKTFREMFDDTLKHNNIDIYKLDKDICYSFVLQHPDNRIVIDFKYPKLYLVEAYSFKDINKDEIEIIRYDIYSLNIDKNIYLPQRYKYDCYNKLLDNYSNTDYDIVGIIIKNLDSYERTKIRNMRYEKIRRLKGNQINMLYHYIELRKENKVKEFLEYFPEYMNEFFIYKKRYIN